MSEIFQNNLYLRSKADEVCIAFGIRICPSPAVVQMAQTNGYDAIFIDLEHSVLNEGNASVLCTTALLANVTPFVRLPYQCGNGFVQRVLDCGAMGVVFPHISSAAEASAAVEICKYPPVGKRSMTGQLPQFSIATNPFPKVIEQSNSQGSAVFLMIETQAAIDNIDGIAAVAGGDVLFVGSVDLSIELGVPGQFDSDKFKRALKTVSAACKRHSKIMGLAGIYDRPELHRWAIHELGVRFILAQQDSGWIAKGSKTDLAAIKEVIASKP